MTYLSLFFIAFGAIIIAYPEFLSYLIGCFFLFVGFNALFMAIALRKNHTSTEKKWNVGSYEIIKKKK